MNGKAKAEYQPIEKIIEMAKLRSNVNDVPATSPVAGQVCILSAEQLESFKAGLLADVRVQVQDVLDGIRGSDMNRLRYGTASQIGQMMGVTKATVNRVLAGMQSIHYVQTEDYMGRKGDKHYDVDEFFNAFLYLDNRNGNGVQTVKVDKKTKARV